jgi:hypothetical protein
MIANLFRRSWDNLAVPALLTLLVACAPTTAAADVTLAGRVFDPGGKPRDGVAVTAYLRNGTQKSTNTAGGGAYTLSVPLDLVVTMDFTDTLYGSVPLNSLAGLENGQINVVVGILPNTASELVTRLANIEALHLRAVLGPEDALPKQAGAYLRDNSTKDVITLRNRLEKIVMPSDVREELNQRAKRLEAALKRWQR